MSDVLGGLEFDVREMYSERFGGASVERTIGSKRSSRVKLFRVLEVLSAGR